MEPSAAVAEGQAGVVAPPAPRQPVRPARPTRLERLEEWRALREEVVSPRDPVAVARQLARGKLLARERIEQLLDPGSFQEMQMMAYTAPGPQLRGKQSYGDGVVAGWGTVAGRRTFVFGQDPTVIGGSLGEVGGAKIHKLVDLAIEAGAPVIGIFDGGGARIQEGVGSLVGFGGIFLRNVRASGVVPQISLIMGVATGGAVYSPALTDFVFMVDGTSAMAITGPKVVREVTGEDVSIDELGGAAIHARRSGVVQFVVPDERTCFDEARRLLGFLPQSNRERPTCAEPRAPYSGTNGWDPLGALPPDIDTPYDVRQIVTGVVDGAEFVEYSSDWARNMVCGFARLDGRPVGVVANQPDVDGGRLDVDACEKAARFVRTCDAFNLPVVTFVDCPGFVSGATYEHNGLIRSAAKLVYAHAEVSSPQVHLVVGRAQGQAAVAMGATPSTAGACLAWPTADFGDFTVYDAAMAGAVDRVIEPHETRVALVEALAAFADLERPPVPRKHENLPL
jgi:acetyl-CoA carboxylase carboxyltransferase component